MCERLSLRRYYQGCHFSSPAGGKTGARAGTIRGAAPTMDIQITTKKSEGASGPGGLGAGRDVREAEEKTARRYASTVRLPGFRPGKVPTALVRKRFRDAIRQQVLETLVNEAFQEIVQREGLRVVAQPHVHDVHFADGQPLTFELHVEVRPEIELARLSGFRLRRGAPEVTDERVAEHRAACAADATWSRGEQPAPGDMARSVGTADDSGDVTDGKSTARLGGGQAMPESRSSME